MRAQHKRSLGVLAAATLLALTGPAFGAGPKGPGDIEQGRYLLKIGGCNDCHTAGYGPSNGKVPESQWLMGDAVGWRGPWGTTYASNLRLVFAGLTEDQWVKTARTVEYRPPMPWFTLRDMRERDLRLMYRYVRSLGPGGKPAPAYVPPDKEPTGPVITFPPPPK